MEKQISAQRLSIGVLQATGISLHFQQSVRKFLKSWEISMDYSLESMIKF